MVMAAELAQEETCVPLRRGRWPGAACWRALGVARLRAADRGCRATCDSRAWAGAQARKLVQRRPSGCPGRARSLPSPTLRRRPLQSDDRRIFFGGVKTRHSKFRRRRGARLGLDNILVYARAPRAQQGRLPAQQGGCPALGKTSCNRRPDRRGRGCADAIDANAARRLQVEY